MSMRFRRLLGAGVLAVALTLVCGVAVAAAQTGASPSLLGWQTNATTLSGTVGVATLNTSQGWFAYTPSYYSGELTAIDMSNPTSPVIRNAAPPGGATQLYASDTVNIYGGVAYVVSKNQNGSCPGAPTNLTGCSNDNGNGNALSLFNVSVDPTTPQLLGSISDATAGVGNTLFGAYGVAVTTVGTDTYALVAAQGCLSGQPCPDNTVGNDLDVIDVQNPKAPTLSGTVYNNPGPSGQYVNALDHPTAVAVSGHYAYVTSFYGHALTVVDFSTPSSPQVVAEIQNTTDFPAPADVAIQGNYAYVANQNSNSGQGTFTVVDISNPTSPQVVGTVNAIGLNGGYRVRVSGDLAYVSASGVASITAVDITNPAAPYVLTSLTSNTHLYRTTGLDLMNLAGSEYVVAASPYTSLDVNPNPAYPPYPGQSGGGTATGTISAIQLDPVADTAILAIHSEPSTNGQPYTTSTSANFIFATGDVVSAVACSLDGAPYGPCSSETTANYSNLAPGQHTFSMQATDGAGNTSVASYSWTIEAAPVNTAPPTITGATLGGQTLTAQDGGWTGNSLAYAYQWQRCDTTGANCTVLRTSTQTYPLTATDVGHTLRVRVTATNQVGSLSATSAATATVKVCPSAGALPAYCARPKLRVRPSVTGTTKVGQTLVASAGVWSKLPASAYGAAQSVTFTARWLRCNARGARCVAIARATRKTYRTTIRDLRHRLKLEVLAKNRNGSTLAFSAPSAPIVAARTRVTLVLSAPARQRAVSRGFIVASVRSNVGALVDVSVGVQVGHGGARWASGKPAEARPGVPLRFRIVLSKAERKRLRRGLAAHERLRALVAALSPGHPGIRPPGSQRVTLTA